MAVTSRLDQGIPERTVIVIVCCLQSEGTLEAILNAMVSKASDRRLQLQEHSIKSGRDLKKVGNRVVAIASMNTCKR